jgi:2-hydroxy-3-keto-5-methylthiopentenyl-1-phosphate phosphatase
MIKAAPEAPSRAPIVFLDFDGTITRRDATDAILEVFADPEWLTIEEEWKRGRIGSRECLTAQMGLVRASKEDVNVLLDSIEVDAGFVPLLERCAALRMPVHIISDGFDYCIHRILRRPSLSLAPLLSAVQVVSSHLEQGAGALSTWRVGFPSSAEPCVHGCGTCKPAAMSRLNPNARITIFVGDGLSDRYAAGCADVVFAKDALAAYCDERAIAYTPYDNLVTVSRRLFYYAERSGAKALTSGGGAPRELIKASADADADADL